MKAGTVDGPHDIRSPFTKEPEGSAVSIDDSLRDLLARSTTPARAPRPCSAWTVRAATRYPARVAISWELETEAHRVGALTGADGCLRTLTSRSTRCEHRRSGDRGAGAVTSLRDTVVHWVDQRVEAMLAAPPMWGSPEAVEMQVLLLLEMRALAHRPEQELAEPRRILDTYHAYLARRFPRAGQRPLHELVGADDEDCTRLAGELRGFLEALAQTPTMAAAVAPVPYDRRDSVRMVDLDRGRILLGPERMRCYLQPGLLGDRAEAGVMARVRGQLYQPLGERPFVLVDSIEMDEVQAEPD